MHLLSEPPGLRKPLPCHVIMMRPSAFQALVLGTLSRRRAYAAARALLASNPLAGLGLGGQPALPAQATEAATEAGDFHWRLAYEDRGRAAVCGGSPRHWRWRVRVQFRPGESHPVSSLFFFFSLLHACISPCPCGEQCPSAQHQHKSQLDLVDE